MEQIIGKTLPELFPNLPAQQLSYFYEVSNEVMNSGISKRGIIEIFPSVRGSAGFRMTGFPISTIRETSAASSVWPLTSAISEKQRKSSGI